MKMIKNKKYLLLGVIVLAALIAVYLFLVNNALVTERQVKVLDYGFSVCTQDVPPSSCGSYEVNVRSVGGGASTYEVAGFDNKEGKQRYDEITARIVEAKEQNTPVTLEVDKKGNITDVK